MSALIILLSLFDPLLVPPLTTFNQKLASRRELEILSGAVSLQRRAEKGRDVTEEEVKKG